MTNINEELKAANEALHNELKKKIEILEGALREQEYQALRTIAALRQQVADANNDLARFARSRLIDIERHAQKMSAGEPKPS